MKSLFNYFLENKLVVNMVVIVLLLIGGYSVLQLKQEEMPQTDIDKMIITAIYPGSSASDVELNVVEPIEREIAQISGISEYTALAIENQARIFIDIDEDVEDKKAVKDEVFRKISIGNIQDLPGEVENINVIDLNPKLKTVYSIVVFPVNDSVTDGELYDYSRKLGERIEKLEGVSEVSKTGYRDREIHIDVNPEKARKLDISLNQIVSSIAARNIRATGGTLQSLTDEKTIVTIGQFEDPLEVGEVILRSNFSGQRVRITDIALIKDTFKESNTKVSVNGKTGVVLSVVKNENADIVKTIENVKTYLENIDLRDSEDFQIDLVDDSSLQIISLLDVVKSNAILGFILVLIILLVFLDYKTAFWTAFGLPMSLAMVFTFMYFADYSLNRISLVAVITVLGMLVDDGIVIAETIYRLRKEGMNAVEAAKTGVAMVIKPVSVAIFTTIVAFLPMLMIKGVMGKFIRVFPIIVTAMLLASLIEALLLLPNHLAHIKTKPKKRSFGDWFNPIRRGYSKFLRFVLRFRYVVLLMFIVVFAFSIHMSKNTIQNFMLTPRTDSNIIYIDLEAPTGTSLETMSQYTNDVDNVVKKIVPKEALVSTKATIGKFESSFFSRKGEYEHWSTVLVTLVPTNERKMSSFALQKKIQKEITKDKFPNFSKITVKRNAGGPHTGEPIDIKIIGDHDDEVMDLVAEMKEYLSSIDGVKNVKDDIFDGKQELKIGFKHEKLAQLGLTVRDVSSTVRTAYDGTIATSVQTADELLDFRVKVDDSYQKDRDYLLSLRIPNNQGRLIKLSEVAYIEEGIGRSNINHFDGERTVSVTGDVTEDKITPAQASMMANKYFDSVAEKYPNTTISVEGEARRTNETFSDLIFAYIIALLLIYFILVLLFKSLSQPFMVVLVVPFGIIGALIAFTLHGMPLSFMGVIGIIGLSGVVVNDSVIMIDLINSTYRKHKHRDIKIIIASVIDGASERLRPVILTTITTVAGLIPTVYGFFGTSELIRPVVMAMAYGLIFATTLTLIFTPALYMINIDISRLFMRKKTEEPKIEDKG